MRSIAIVIFFAFVLGIDAAHADSGPHAGVSDPLGTCQQAVARATRQVGDGIRREIGKCIAAGMRCLTTAPTDLAACCAAASPRCRAQERKLAIARGRLVSRIATGRCAALPIATILDSTGLGFESSADTCRCLPSPREVSDLPSLAGCLGDLVDVETIRVLAIAEAPRAAEALACVGLDREAASLAAGDTAAACPPNGTPTASAATPTIAATSGGPTPRATRTQRPRRTPVPDASATVSATATITPSAAATPHPTTTPTRTAVPPTPTATRTPIPVCGNGIVEGDEECDGNAYDDSGCLEDVCTCDDFCDDAGGRLGCRRNCTIDFSRCTAGGCEF